MRGNLIGTDATGQAPLGNAGFGIAIGGGNIVIGGTDTSAENVISANHLGGVNLFLGSQAGDTLLEGNLIGTNWDATADLGNLGSGVSLGGSGYDVGEGLPGGGNVIAFNHGAGVTVQDGPFGGLRNRILANAIFSNTGLGIDLVGGNEDMYQVTANDPGDGDIGANNLQNYPTISAIAISGSDRSVDGTLTSAPNGIYTLDFYANSEVDPSGYGEGEIWLGSLAAQTNAQGSGDFSFPLDARGLGRFITATATDSYGNTSEFSRASDFVPLLSRLLNISTRLRVQTGDNVLIGGFIITGNDPKKVIVRAIGPSLGGADLLTPLADPVLELHKPDGTVITNDNWRSSQEDAILASGVPPANDLESAIVRTLDPGSYTAIVRGKNGGTGIGLVETFDLDQSADSELANVSTRGIVGTGENVLIGGIIVGPEEAADASVLIRALGPSLTDLGVPGALADPTLELHNGDGDLIASNDNWKSSQKAAIEAAGIPPTADKESALIASLSPGNYTAIVSGADGGIGVGLVEAYHLE